LIDEKPIEAALSRDIGAGKKVEAELDAFISRRDKQHRQTEGERAGEAAWRESERRHEAARREANRLAWVEYHLNAADRCRTVLGSLASYHEAEAEKYRAAGEVA
jgi:hypothetical protein